MKIIYLEYIPESSQDQQTYSENVDPAQGYNHEKFERSRLNSIREKGNVKVLFKQGNMSIISREHVRKSKMVVY